MRRTGADSHLAIRRLLMMLFIVAAILSVLFPQWLTWVAFADRRGTRHRPPAVRARRDVLTFVYTQYRRNLALQRQLTLLARRIALLDAENEEQRPTRNR